MYLKRTWIYNVIKNGSKVLCIIISKLKKCNNMLTNWLCNSINRIKKINQWNNDLVVLWPVLSQIVSIKSKIHNDLVMIKTLFVSNKTQWFLWVLTSIGFSSSSLGPDFNGINIEPSFGTYQLWHHRHLPSKKTWRRPHLASSCHCSKCHWATSIASQRSERQNYNTPCNSWIY